MILQIVFKTLTISLRVWFMYNIKCMVKIQSLHTRNDFEYFLIVFDPETSLPTTRTRLWTRCPGLKKFTLCREWQKFNEKIFFLIWNLSIGRQKTFLFCKWDSSRPSCCSASDKNILRWKKWLPVDIRSAKKQKKS